MTKAKPARKTQRLAKKKRRAPLLPAGVRAFLSRQTWRLLGLSLIALFVAFCLLLFSFDPADPTLNQATDRAAENWLGPPGAAIADILLQTLGLGALALIAPLAGWGIRIVTLKGLPFFWTHVLILPASVLAWSVLAATVTPGEDWPVHAGYGGVLGQFLFRQIEEVMAAVGLIVPIAAYRAVFGLLGGLCLLTSLGISRGDWRGFFSRFLGALWTAAGAAGRAMKGLFSRSSAQAGPRRRQRKGPASGARRAGASSRRVKGRKKTRQGTRDTRERQGSLFGDLDGSRFKLPPLDLLNKPEPSGTQNVSTEALEQNARLLESVLDDFGIQGEIINVRPGPVVTLYELEPAPGTKSARVIGLADDIARSMSAVSARVAVIPGRNAIGIELPNSRRESVSLREILASQSYENAQSRLPLVLGKAIGGEPVIADLASMPHLLVAGTTGSGKSVGLNTMILSLIYRLPPDQCKFILVDPKMLELSVYENIPHLLHPVVTEPKKAVVALKWAVREMEERYRAMSKIGVRNIGAYNKRVAEARASGQPLKRRVQTGFDKETGEPVYEEQAFDLEAFPLIVIVIDEMADLMLVAGKDVEAMVQRLAQMARAAGLHVIMATQRPSVDVITGTIKANFPTRVSYQVTSKIDSRTILGEQGAEQLLGQGDMLFMAGGGRISRVHGAFVSDQEVERIVSFLKRQGAPDYVEEVTEEPDDGFDSPFIPGPSADDQEASLYDKAVDIVQRDRRASTSYIQRRLKIGYNRAASLIERMEDDGVISAPNHAGKREVLVPERD